MSSMAIALPIRSRVLPSVLAGLSNGELPASVLTTITMPSGQTAVVLAQCATKWLAFLDAAAAAGFLLGQDGDYRTKAEQIALLEDRYVVVTSAPWDITWDGKHWRKKPGEATVATPGTSNHGVGLALDLTLVVNGQVVSLASPAGVHALAWMVANEEKYGLSHELKSEPWHVRPFDGDAKTPAVLAYEAAHPSALTGDTMTVIAQDKDKGAQVHGLMLDILAAGGALPASTKTDGTLDDTFGPEVAGQLAGLLGVGDGKSYDTGDRAVLWVLADRRKAAAGIDMPALAKAVAALIPAQPAPAVDVDALAHEVAGDLHVTVTAG